MRGIHSPCPHGRKRETCQFTSYGQASKCPSSRSPHRIRTGAITWFLNRGWPPEDVAERVNASVDTIEQHYDKADPDERRRRLRERMEDRRRKLVDQLQIQTHEPHDNLPNAPPRYPRNRPKAPIWPSPLLR